MISGVITNATQQGFFIQTHSKVEKGNLFFTYKDEKSNVTLYFDCDILRTDHNGIAVSYNLLSDDARENVNCRHEENRWAIKKGRFLDYYL